MNTETREQFEAYFAASRKSKGAGRNVSFDRLADGTYADDHTQRHWWTWQQAIAAAQLTTAKDYEELRSIIDGGSETATHADAVAKLKQWEGASWTAAQPAGEPAALSGRAEIVAAWNDLPDSLRCHPGLKRFFQALQKCDNAPPLSAPPEGWRPIETAPKGQVVLLWGTRYAARAFMGDWDDYDEVNQPRITHWMPLPDAPKEPKA